MRIDFHKAAKRTPYLRRLFFSSVAGVMSFVGIAQGTGDSIPPVTLTDTLTHQMTLTDKAVSVDKGMDKDCACHPPLTGMHRWRVLLMEGSSRGSFGGSLSTKVRKVSDFIPMWSGTLVGDLSYMNADIRQVPLGQFNTGGALEYRISHTFTLAAGGYQNRLDNISTFLTLGAETNCNRLISTGINVGGVTGYDQAVIPSVMPYIRMGPGDRNFNVKIAVTSPVSGVIPMTVNAQVRLNLNYLFKKKPLKKVF